MAAVFRADGWVKGAIGVAVAGAQVYVCTQPANVTPPVAVRNGPVTGSFVPNPLASIFSDANGLVPIVQPISTDGFGHYDFYAGRGLYTAVIVNGGQIQQVYVDQSLGGAGSGDPNTTGLVAGTNISIVGNVISATSSAPVSSVFGRIGAVTAQVGDYSSFYDPLGAAAAALVAAETFTTAQGYATLASPAFTGTPTAPTALTADSSTKIATTAFVKAQGYVTSNPVTSVFGRVGVVVAGSGDYAVGQITGAAPLASPTFTGSPAAPTATLSDSSTLLATTAFVKGQGYSTAVSLVPGPTTGFRGFTATGAGTAGDSAIGMSNAGNFGSTTANALDSVQGQTVQLTMGGSTSAAGCGDLSGSPIQPKWFKALQCQSRLSALTHIRMWIGLASAFNTNLITNSPSANAVSGAAFRFTAGTDTNFMCCLFNGAATNAVSSGVAADVNPHQFIILQPSAGTYTFYIDGVLVATMTTDAPGNTTNLNYVAQVDSVNSAVVTTSMFVSYMYWWSTQ